MYVVLDSNLIIEKDWQLSSPAALVLFEASRRGGIDVAVPELVVREVTAKHHEREAATISKLENTRSSLRRLQAAFSSDDRVPVEGVSDRWAADFRKRLKDALVEIPPIDAATHDELVERALARRRPFDGEGRAGYRDALIWHAVLALAVKDEVVLVSGDGDFGDDALHPHLVDELKERGLAGRVRLFSSMEDAIRALFEPANALVEELNERLRSDSRFHDQLVEELRKTHHHDFAQVVPEVDVDLESHAEPYSHWITEYNLDDLFGFRDLKLVRAYPAGGDVFSVELTIDAEAQFRVEISTEAWLHRPPQTPFEIASDERSFYATGLADVRLEYWSRYSRASASFEEHELVAMENR